MRPPLEPVGLTLLPGFAIAKKQETVVGTDSTCAFDNAQFLGVFLGPAMCVPSSSTCCSGVRLAHEFYSWFYLARSAQEISAGMY
jgi:hypothetical protein